MGMDKTMKLEGFGYVYEMMGNVTGPEDGTVTIKSTGEVLQCVAYKVIAYKNFTWMLVIDREYTDHIESEDRTIQVDMEIAGIKYDDIKMDFSKDRHMLISYYQYPCDKK